MSVYLDQKYLLLISNRLPLFKRKSDSLFNCRCIICGDSSKNMRKARGYFFKHKTDIRYKCHNCEASLSFGNFLKQLDQTVYAQYVLEKYTEGQVVKVETVFQPTDFTAPKFKSEQERLLDRILVSLDKLPNEHEAIKFCLERQIPIDQLKKLYYIENIKDIVQLNDKYKESIKTEEPRIVIPFYDENGQLTAVTCRALRGEALRYITVKIKEDAPLIFGLDYIDKLKPVYVVEGPLDSLFLKNCIAVGSTSLDRAFTTGLKKEQVILVYDNQPRNKEVCKIIEKSISKDQQVVIWPQTIMEKDINDMVLAGRDVNKLVRENTYQGLIAKAKFISWKRC